MVIFRLDFLGTVCGYSWANQSDGGKRKGFRPFVVVIYSLCDTVSLIYLVSATGYIFAAFLRLQKTHDAFVYWVAIFISKINYMRRHV